MTYRRSPGLIAIGLLAAVAAPVRAQTSESGTVDAVRGTIQGSTRYIGLGGAFVAIADDIEGVPINPASAAVRLPYSWKAFGFAFGVDVSVSTWLPKNDLYNAPDSEGSSESGSLFGSLGFLFNYRHAGFGLTAQAANNEVSQGAQGVSSKLSANFGLMHTVAAYGFLDGQLQLGAGLRIVGFSFDGSEKRTPLTAGVGAVAGVILKPKGRQFRIGVDFQQAIDAKVSSMSGAPPVNVEVPWTAALGFAYQFGTRKLNPSFVTVDERARRNTEGREPTKDELKQAARELFAEYQEKQTWYLLLSTELALIEGGGNMTLGGSLAVDRPLISPRLGLETEVVPRWLRLRAGSYLELATMEGADARLHGTVGADIKLFAWSVFGLVAPFNYWQLSLAADGADSYLNTSFSIGFWH
jgi:hypothetical protein